MKFGPVDARLLSAIAILGIFTLPVAQAAGLNPFGEGQSHPSGGGGGGGAHVSSGGGGGGGAHISSGGGGSTSSGGGGHVSSGGGGGGVHFSSPGGGGGGARYTSPGGGGRPSTGAAPIFMGGGRTPASSGNAPSSGVRMPGSGPGFRPGAVLPHENSQQVVSQLNSFRARMGGDNARPIPGGTVRMREGGGVRVDAPGGRSYLVGSNGHLQGIIHGNESASFRGDGKLSSFRSPNFQIARNPRGSQTIIRNLPDHSQVVRLGPRAGYHMRTVSRDGHQMLQRNYLMGGRSFSREYWHHRRPILWGGGGYYWDYWYWPGYWYDPFYFDWFFDIASAPYPYYWRFHMRPGYYGGYFAPWGYYRTGSYWLTDYVIGQTLDTAYLSESNPASGDVASAESAATQAPASAINDPAATPLDDLLADQDTPISEQLKKKLAREVEWQLKAEKKAQETPDKAPEITGLDAVLKTGHLFLTDMVLNMTTVHGEACSVSAGDVLELVEVPDEGETQAIMLVRSSRKGDCPAGQGVMVEMENLNEMHNNFRAQINEGMKQIYDEQGTNGLPRLSAQAGKNAPRLVDQAVAATQDENLPSLLDQGERDALKAENAIAELPAAQ